MSKTPITFLSLLRKYDGMIMGAHREELSDAQKNIPYRHNPLQHLFESMREYTKRKRLFTPS